MAFCLAGELRRRERQKRVALKGRAGDNQDRAGGWIASRGPDRSRPPVGPAASRDPRPATVTFGSHELRESGLRVF